MNGDTMMNERIILVIDNSVFLTEHAFNTYNFPGGNIPFNYLSKNIGTTSLKELEEEFGITFQNKPIIKLAGYFFHNNTKCLKLLVFAKVKKDDILFGKATHVWESKSFTMVPLDDNKRNDDDLGTFLKDGITETNNECATHITYSDEIVDKIIYDSDSNISKDDNTYYIKLNENPNLSVAEKEILKMLNGKITGYNDEKYVYTDDYICKYKYIPFNRITNTALNGISRKYKMSNPHNYTFNVNVNYEKLLDYLYRHQPKPLHNYNNILSHMTSNEDIKSIYTRLGI